MNLCDFEKYSYGASTVGSNATGFGVAFLDSPFRGNDYVFVGLFGRVGLGGLEVVEGD